MNTTEGVFLMPWGAKTVEEKRKDFFHEAQRKDRNMSKLCLKYGISRKTGYKWLKRWNEERDLNDQSRKPLNSPQKTDEVTERAITQLRQTYPTWGARKLAACLRKQDINVPSERTVNNILQRNGMIAASESLKRKAYCRFVREHCNELWQADFKGDFLLGDGSRCFPLTVLDDHSRFSIWVEAKPGIGEVRGSFTKAFNEYGLPYALLTDNGWSFRAFHGGFTQFERWLMDHDVLPIHGRPQHPQTQGKIERFHRSMNEELLAGVVFKDLVDAQSELSRWRHRYNNERPHQALNMHCPAEVYLPSSRCYDEKVHDYDYGNTYPIRKTNNWGYLRFGPIRFYLSDTFMDTYLQVRQIEERQTFRICYRNFGIAEVDPDAGKIISRSIIRL